MERCSTGLRLQVYTSCKVDCHGCKLNVLHCSQREKGLGRNLSSGCYPDLVVKCQWSFEIHGAAVQQLAASPHGGELCLEMTNSTKSCPMLGHGSA